VLRKNQVTTDAQSDDCVDLCAAAVQFGSLSGWIAGNVTGARGNLFLRDPSATDLAAHRRDLKKSPKQVRQDVSFPVQFDAERDPHMLATHPVAEVNEFRDTT